jgi:hydrogenase maturation factor
VKTGKLDLEQIESLFKGGLGHLRDDVIYGPAVGLDCGVVDIGNGFYGVLKSDPITFATERVGWYAVNVNANDIATSGATARWFLSTILLPRSSSLQDADNVCRDIHEAAEALGVSVVGGHTEVTHAVNQIVVMGTMVGVVEKEKLIHPSNILPGDILLVTKGAAIEATAIAALEKSGKIISSLGEAVQKEAAGYLNDPGISIIPDAQILLKHDVHGMHDATEGGLRAAVYEMGKAAGLPVTLESDKVPVSFVTREICRLFNMDPLGAIGSGALLAALSEDSAKKAIVALAEIGIPSAIIGCFGSKGAESSEYRSGQVLPLNYEPHDEITKLFF